MGRIRSFTKDDIPQVADLHKKVFLKGSGPSSEALRSYFEEIFFKNPWYDRELPSLVYQDTPEKITGFFGVLPRRMLMNGAPIRVAVATQFMVDPSSRASLAGLELMKTYLNGPQELSMTDGANDYTRKIWEALRGVTSFNYSFDWLRLLRPARFITERLKTRGMLAPFAWASQPFCTLMDALAARIPQSHFRQVAPPAKEENAGADTFGACLPKFIDSKSLQPDYNNISFKWLLENLEKTKGHGTFCKSLVHNARQEVIGWYFYFLKRNGISQVLQIVANENTINQVLDHLFYHAWRRGAVALAGRLVPKFVQAFSDKYCLFMRSGTWTLIYSKNQEIINTIQSGKAFLNRLEGEWWMRFQVDFS